MKHYNIIRNYFNNEQVLIIHLIVNDSIEKIYKTMNQQVTSVGSILTSACVISNETLLRQYHTPHSHLHWWFYDEPFVPQFPDGVLSLLIYTQSNSFCILSSGLMCDWEKIVAASIQAGPRPHRCPCGCFRGAGRMRVLPLSSNWRHSDCPIGLCILGPYKLLTNKRKAFSQNGRAPFSTTSAQEIKQSSWSKTLFINRKPTSLPTSQVGNQNAN